MGVDLLLKSDFEAHRPRLVRYLRIHEGWSPGKARAEARRIVDLLWEAYHFEQALKKMTKTVNRMLESPEEQNRRAEITKLLTRLDDIQRRYTGRLTKGTRRWCSEIRRNAKTVRAPSPKRLQRLTEQIDRLELHLHEHVQGVLDDERPRGADR